MVPSFPNPALRQTNVVVVASPAGDASAVIAPSVRIRPRVGICYAAFAISGFAGLMYESVWSRYLQTFLGAEAYAQALVLALFLGGMAGGAWMASRFTVRLRRPLLAYGVMELLLALFALTFHWVFDGTTAWTFQMVVAEFPPWAVETWRWVLSSLLILPQCVLLGTTFPLLAAGVIREGESRQGRALGWLYFANSAGGAIGVLANGFLFVPTLGLTGTVVLAGLVSALAGGLAWAAGRFFDLERSANEPAEPRAIRRRHLCLAAAAITGAASLVYELVWIRLLSLVLGSSNHAFELMLSAFIGGLALGGFWIRRRADTIANPLAALGVIQLLMGALALATLVFYRQAFDAMHWMLQAFARTEPGYTLYLLGSHALALAVMLPATICAGMTLPLLTRYQMTEGGGERVIGRTYAANTVGAIVGVLGTTHLFLPQLGIKGAMLFGAGLDLALGAWLLVLAGRSAYTRLIGVPIALGVLVVVGLRSNLDAKLLDSGVFAGRSPTSNEDGEMLFYRHGKTATIGVMRYPLGDGTEVVGFTTNGKGNGSLLFNAEPEQATADEPSFGLLGLLPHALKPEAETAACIGVGTGLTAHYLLGSEHLSTMDIVELEPATVDAARLFEERTGRVFSDTRVRFHQADAKTFFGSKAASYDVILSQPSNTWMPGVAGLYTKEFYAGIRGALASDGLFVQWIQLYAADNAMVLSVLAALGENFEDYRLYLATQGDLLVVAAKEGEVPEIRADAFAWPSLASAWTRVGVRHVRDLELRWAGGRAQVEPLLKLQNVPANSDYQPILETRALRAFYLRQGFSAAGVWMDAFGFPLMANLAMRDFSREGGLPTERSFYPRSATASTADQLVALVRRADAKSDGVVPPGGSGVSFGTLLPFDEWFELANAAPCDDFAVAAWPKVLAWLVRVAAPNLDQRQLESVWAAFNNLECAAELRATDAPLHDFVGAALLRDYETVAEIGPALLKEAPAARPYVAIATATAHFRLGDYDEVLAIFKRVAPPAHPHLLDALALLAAHVEERRSAQ